ncbi:putative DNA polymerase III, delta subunit [Thiomonas arsenitoxydans]|uniref:DNA polymerase III subunit delta n=1 Tax=Thiomonas arsenitoxydans (strain DSM 22701 / CIP 110005 / 3As) TaxID=426114 RepID=D6CQN1_THIA3|nr:DNA polymerase III subunit delta [Thiomonas arsenitoxydans]CAZ86922.1 putative DNA polymerase III, delta subunit [Thiomonas arsenitoxydans]CQR27920.1 putative DNA polymerase III, delta subunit [Thiomonas arsenitoxydans]CQR30360.1 putative DNA polymerase III, delta subunit [Thiomonas arsenitoxydans]CQR32013.1 putative DNA polymerase III, delta subunit [Thiomonas arsenitoxydans]CQR34056.1 putative DNA polymerase III, delta subunit [Thiomonas arsenitoxydans]
MQLAADQLDAHLASKLGALYVVYGDETLLVNEAVDAIRARARQQGFDERESHTVERGFDWSHLLAGSREISLFGGRRLIELRIPGGKPGRDGGEALAALADHLSADVMAVVILPRLDAATQKSAWFSALSQGGVAVRVDSVELAQLPRWIAARLQRHGFTLPASDAGRALTDFLVARVEGNLLAAHQEIEKLALLCPPGPLDPDTVEQAVLNVARYSVFKLGEAVLGGDVARLRRMLDGLQAEGVAPVLVHWTLADDIRAWLRIRQGLDAGQALPALLRANRIWGVKEKLLERALPRLRTPDLERLLQLAAQCDLAVKGLRPDSLPRAPWEALQVLALSMLDALWPTPPSARQGRRLVLHPAL